MKLDLPKRACPVLGAGAASGEAQIWTFVLALMGMVFPDPGPAGHPARAPN
ncbi:hypothetical protein [Deinococcus radiophilus]|uniref:hypothetical protein n=1 Tax=Deinococcus radiophilus TaxID=32062 RepID=UPI0014728DB1|nr:hypothetical protein [Deinococcus radiophilus]UFA51835.1 hypothetical protein LMT64_12350 [Deinococcus radiophilus]